MHSAVRVAFAASVCWIAGSVVAQEPDEIVEVVGRTPLGAGIDADRVAANVQQVAGEQIREQQSLDLSQFMQRNLASVFVNEAQSNPLQPDVQYRGFVGSPLLGLPQGLAVYQDGVRLNEPFGDTVSWALLPDSAIENMFLMPGSNPMFGLNALGGAISIRTRDGFTSPGTTFEAYGGSFGRIGVQATTGGSVDEFGWFVTGEMLDEDGWRDGSPTAAEQLFGKLSFARERTDLSLSLNAASTDLIGNGPLPVQLMAVDRSAVYTRPDRTQNDLAMLVLSATHELSSRASLSGNLYVRSSDIDTLNGDDSEFVPCTADPDFICETDGDDEAPVLDADGTPVVTDPDLLGAAINRTATGQKGAGFGLQGSLGGEVLGRDNELVVGIVYDSGRVDFAASTELGTLDESRLAVPGGVLVGEAFTSLETDVSNLGVFVSDTLLLGRGLALTVSGRFNDTQVTLSDRLGTALDGDHGFQRFNPAIGLTAVLLDDLTLYAGYSESARAPSPVELTCADPDDPCRLPNAFLADPPLEQVVAHTLEAGLRGRADVIDWHAGLFRTTNHDDILFISAGALTNQGFFDNVGRTRRDGIEINLAGAPRDAVRWFAAYTFLDATFLRALSLPSPNNPIATNGEVLVRPGDRLPLVPRHLFKGGVDWNLTPRFSLAANLTVSSGFHLRGDEGNDVAEIGRHALLNLRARYEIDDRLELFLTIDNLFDRTYESFGLFGEADEVLGDAFDDPRFVSPGPPRSAWLGARIRL